MDSGGLINGVAHQKRAYEAFVGALRSYESTPGAMRRTWSTPGSRTNNNVYKISKGSAAGANSLNVIGQGVNDMHLTANATSDNWRAYRTGWEELAKVDPKPAPEVINGKWDGNWAHATMPAPARPRPLANNPQIAESVIPPSNEVPENAGAQPAVLTHQASAPQFPLRRPVTAAPYLGVPTTRQARHCNGNHNGFPIEAYGSVFNNVRPGSAKQAQQMVQSAFLSQPKWREVPFEKYLIATDRKELLKRKYQYQNRLFSYN